MNIHYARRMPSVSYAFGLFDEEKLIGVCTYGQPASPAPCRGIAGVENKKNVLELSRLVISPECTKKNCASYLIANSLRMLPNHTFVISYADWGGWHHVGYVYQATNWLYTGMTKPRTDIVSESGGHARHYVKGETKRQGRTAKHRYVYLVGDRREKRKMMAELRWKVLEEYPKGESRRYDTENPISVEEEGAT